MATVTTYDGAAWGTGEIRYVPHDENAAEISRDGYMAVKNKKNKSRKSAKNGTFKSEMLKWTVDNVGLNPDGAMILINSPISNLRDNALMKDFQRSVSLGYASHITQATTYIVDNPFDGHKHLVRIFVDGVLEHLPGTMAQALFLKRLMSKMHPGRACYLMLCTKTREQLHKEAKHNNYPPDGGGYLVTLPGGKQSRIEGIDNSEVESLIAYGRLGSIWKSDTLSKLRGSHIIIWNGV